MRERLDDWLRDAIRGEPDALGRLVDCYGNRVFGLVFRLTGDRDAAEELTQETFLRVVRTIQRYEHDGRFEAWLFRIAANLARDHARRGARRGVMQSLDGTGRSEAGGRDAWSAEPCAGESAAPEASLLREERGVELDAALAKLPDADREILYLRHFAELSFKEIADVLGVPLGTALARAHRAVRRLRSDLGATS